MLVAVAARRVVTATARLARTLPSLMRHQEDAEEDRESEARTIWRHGRIYGLGNLLSRLAAFLLVPVLLHALSPEEWGVYALTLVVGQLIMVVPSGIIRTNVRLYFDQSDETGRNIVVGTTFVVFSCAAVLLLVLAYPLALVATEVIFGDREYVWVFFLANVALIFQMLLVIELDFLRVRKRSGLYLGSSLVRSLAQFGVSIVLVLGFGMGVMGVVLGQLAACAMTALPIAAIILSRTGIPFRRELAREMLRLGGPLIPAWFARAADGLSARYLLNLLTSTATLGLYAVADKVADQLRQLLSEPIANIAGIRLLEIGDRAERAAEFSRAQVYVTFVLASAGLALALFGPEILRVIAAEEFWSAAAVVPFLALIYVLDLTVWHFETVLIQRKKTVYLPLSNWSALAVGIPALFLLVPSHGILGGAIAVLLGQAFRFGATVWFASRCSSYVALFPWASYATVLGLAIGTYAASVHLTGGSVSATNFVLKLGLLAAFVVGAYYSPAFSGEERRAFQRFCLSRLPRLGTRREREPS